MLEYNITIQQFIDILDKNKIVFNTYNYNTNIFSAFDIASYYSGNINLFNDAKTINELINKISTNQYYEITEDIISFNTLFKNLKMNNKGTIIFNNEEAEIAFKLKYL